MSPFTDLPSRLLHSSEEARKTPTDQLQEDPIYIFFITGNPGLIAYYEPFLSSLSSLLSSSPSSSSTSSSPSLPYSFVLLGTSIPGFETSSVKHDLTGSNGGSLPPCHPPPYGLLQQIEFAETRLRAFVRDHHHSRSPRLHHGLNSDDDDIDDANQFRSWIGTPGGRKRPKVILMGHSVGAYILLEIIRRVKMPGNANHGLDIVGGVLLFPTVTHIIKSPSGRRFGVCDAF